LSCCGRLDGNPTTGSSSGKHKDSRGDPGVEAEQQCEDNDDGLNAIEMMSSGNDGDDSDVDDDEDSSQYESGQETPPPTTTTRHEPKANRAESDEVKM
jgi:hypothetical protein